MCSRATREKLKVISQSRGLSQQEALRIVIDEVFAARPTKSKKARGGNPKQPLLLGTEVR